MLSIHILHGRGRVGAILGDCGSPFLKKKAASPVKKGLQKSLDPGSNPGPGPKMVELRILARYPFLHEAKEYLKDIELDELLSSPLYEDLREYGTELVKSCFTGNKPFLRDLRGRIIGFYVAKLLLMALQDPIITRRFANMIRDELEKSLRNDEDYVLFLIADFFEIRYKRANEDIKRMNAEYGRPWLPENIEYKIFVMLHFIDFITHASKLSGKDFKLLYQPMMKGWIPITRENFIKIIREAFVKRFVDDIEAQSEKSKLLRGYFKRDMEEIQNLKDEYISQYTSSDFGNVVEDAFPPCLKAIIVKLRNGINLPHQARFFLVTFLHKIGVSNEEIMKIFATAPDFNESMTKYQVEHITGGISKKEYEVPKCATLQSYGLCVKDIAKDKLCNREWMTHPLLYYKLKKEWLSKRRKFSGSQ